MAETSNDKLFRTKVLPIMDKVMRDLRLKQSEEMAIHTSSLPYIMAGAAGPDGGMSAQAASLASLRYTGKWNSKHTEDYIQMVKDELKKQHIIVTPEIEKMMIEKMIKDEIPKSSLTISCVKQQQTPSSIFPRHLTNHHWRTISRHRLRRGITHPLWKKEQVMSWERPQTI